MAKRIETKTVSKVEDEIPSKMKVKLKCNYDIVDKDGKVTTKKPDDVIEVAGEEGLRLINMAFAVRV